MKVKASPEHVREPLDEHLNDQEKPDGIYNRVRETSISLGPSASMIISGIISRPIRKALQHLPSPPNTHYQNKRRKTNNKRATYQAESQTMRSGAAYAFEGINQLGQLYALYTHNFKARLSSSWPPLFGSGNMHRACCT